MNKENIKSITIAILMVITVYLFFDKEDSSVHTELSSNIDKDLISIDRLKDSGSPENINNQKYEKDLFIIAPSKSEVEPIAIEETKTVPETISTTNNKEKPNLAEPIDTLEIQEETLKISGTDTDLSLDTIINLQDKEELSNKDKEYLLSVIYSENQEPFITIESVHAYIYKANPNEIIEFTSSFFNEPRGEFPMLNTIAMALQNTEPHELDENQLLNTILHSNSFMSLPYERQEEARAEYKESVAALIKERSNYYNESRDLSWVDYNRQ